MGGITFWETYIRDALVNALENILDIEKNNKNGSYSGTCTVNGFQTNAVHENETYKNILKELLSYIPDGNKFYYRWFHLIDYNKFGRQEKHNHEKTEDYSFIVYLNTCSEGGETVFETPNAPLFISKPIKNKLLCFPSYLNHYGEPVIESKKIAVGGLKFIQPNA